ncbi:MAG: 2-phosphosulfolactate phosphatase [Paludibacteraceae bacterium]
MNDISVCFSPALFPFYTKENAITVIIDVFRATTSICTAFQNGTLAIRTMADLDKVLALKNNGFLVAAERNTLKCDFADFGNSPFDFTPEKVAGKEIIFTTTNGTRAVEVALESDEILIGSFSNMTTLTEYCTRQNKNIILVCSGWNNRFCLEDALFAGSFIEKITSHTDYTLKSDASIAAVELWRLAKSDIKNYICKSEHFERLRQNGCENEVDYCLTENTANVLPAYDKAKGYFTLKQLP